MICDECETVVHCMKNGCVPKTTKKDEALKLALEALENSIDLVSQEARNAEELYGKYPTRLARIQGLVAFEVAHEKAITAVRKALAEQPAPATELREQDTASLFKWLPEGATHIGRISVRTTAGGSLAMTAYTFKYDNEALKVYVTDNDNEYPGWRDAKDCFFHLNFPVLPLYTSPPAQRKPLTDEEITRIWAHIPEPSLRKALNNFARAIEAAHGIKENT